MADNVNYGGVVLQLVSGITPVTRETVWSEDRTTYLYTRWTLPIRAVFNPKATALSPGVMPVVSDVALRHALAQPRRQLTITIGGVTWLKSPLVGFDRDACNGPRPVGEPTIVRIDGIKSFLVDWTVEVCTIECPSAQALLSNRYTETHDVDDCGYTTRTIQGRAYFRADTLAKDKRSADSYREALFVKIPPKFVRENFRVLAKSDGTEIAYTIVDTQREFSLGEKSPVTRFEGTSTVAVGFGKEGGTSPLGAHTVRMHAWGNANTHRFDLVQWAVKAALAELEAGGNRGIIREASIQKSMHSKEVQVEITSTHPPEERTMRTSNTQAATAVGGGGVLAIAIDRLKANDWPTAGIDATETKNPLPVHSSGGTRGSWNAVILRQTLETACTAPAAPGSTVTFKDAASGGAYMTGKPAVEVTITDELPTDPTIYNSDAKREFITRYEITMKSKRKENILEIPIAKDDDGSKTDDTVFIRTGAPQSRKYASWVAEAIGNWPILPDKTTGDKNDVFLFQKIMGKSAYPMADGNTLLYVIRGLYVFGQKRATDQDIEMGVSPYLKTKPADTKLTSAAFQTGLLGSGGATTNVLKAGGS